MIAGATDESNNRMTKTIDFNNLEVIYVYKNLTSTIYCIYKFNWK